MTLRKGLALSILWADVPRADLAAAMARAAVEPVAADPSAGVLAVARYAAVAGGPALVEIHELIDDGPGPVVASTGLLRASPVVVGAASQAVYRQVFPPAVDERAAVHGLAPALQVGRIGIPPEHEEEFNEWYNTEYLVGYLGVPGVYGARRYVNTGAGPRYLTVYELAHPEVSRQPEWDRVRGRSVWRRRIERLWAHDGGSPAIYRRLAGA